MAVLLLTAVNVHATTYYVQPATYSTTNLLTDGDMETWTNSTTPETWSISSNGNSTVNRESSVPHAGSSACRIDIDDSNNSVAVSQKVTLSANSQYKLVWWFKSTGTGTMKAFIKYTDGSTYTLQPDGNWAASTSGVPAVGPSEAWTLETTHFSTPNFSGTYTLSFSRSVSSSTSLYIDDVSIVQCISGGNDSASGMSPSTPWATARKVNAIGLAAETFAAGDSILFAAGNSWAETVSSNTNGASGHPIVYGMYGTGAKPILQGFSAVTAGNDIILQDMEFSNASKSGVYIEQFSNILLQRLYIHDCTGASMHGIELADHPSNITIRDCTITGNANRGIWGAVNGSNTIENCTIYANGLNNISFSPYASGSSITIRNNRLYNSLGGVGFGTAPANDNTMATITGNQIYGNYNSGIICHTEGVAASIVITCNTIYNNGSSGISIGDASGKTTLTSSIYNNTIYGNTDAAIIIRSTGAQTFKNNIFANNGYYLRVLASGAEPLISDYNLFYGSAQVYIYATSSSLTLTQWQAYTGNAYDQHSVTDDPKFIDAPAGDFRLTSLSPAIDSGIDVGLRADYLGNPIVGAPDIGAYEVQKEQIAPPLNFLVSDVPNDNGRILRLTWDKSSSESQGLVSWYRIFRSRNSTLTDPIPITSISTVDSIQFYERFYTLLVDSVAAGIVEYNDLVTANKVKYYYWIQAVGSKGISTKVVAESSTQVKDIPAQFFVSPPFPNPFNPSTTIGISLKTDSHLTLSIFNVYGQRVATLADEKMKAGQYSFTWNGKGMSSGMYLCKVQTEKKSVIKKMLLLK